MPRNRKKPSRNKPDYYRPFFRKQRNTVYGYLRKRLATASMISAATGVPLNYLRWYKRDLEKEGKLWVVKTDICQITGHRAGYLTTNPKLVSEATKTNEVSK